MMSLLNQPWLAMTITVIDSKDNGLIGLQGMIVDETKHTLRVRSSKGGSCDPKGRNQIHTRQRRYGHRGVYSHSKARRQS